MDWVLALAGSGQGGHEHAPALEANVLLIVIVLLGVATALLARSIGKRRRRAPTVDDEWKARAVMGELCPDGWQANITVYGWGAPMPADAPPSRAPLVELEWKHFDAGGEVAALPQRAWASSIRAGLATMVEHQRNHLLFEQVEQASSDADDASAPES